jgi:hypothetical protein
MGIHKFQIPDAWKRTSIIRGFGGLILFGASYCIYFQYPSSDTAAALILSL